MSDQTINPAEDEKYILNCSGFSVAQFAMVAGDIASATSANNARHIRTSSAGRTFAPVRSGLSNCKR